MKNASLVRNPENKGFKEIYEIDGSGQQFYPSKTSKLRVVVRPSYDEEIRNAIKKLGISWDTQEAYALLGEVLRNAICQDPENNIAWDECTDKGYMTFKIQN